MDLNLDAGESRGALDSGQEALLYDQVTSVNIACGGHAGDAYTMSKAIDLALERKLNIGAHPGYPDLAGFGRVPMNLKFDSLVFSLCEQLENLFRICQKKGAHVTHVKPHGALYNRASNDKVSAQAVIETVRKIDSRLIVIGLAGSNFRYLCEDAGLTFLAEGFPDRRYETSGELRDRCYEDAIIANPDEAAQQALVMAKGNWISKINTLCVHGDTPNALQIAGAIRSLLLKEGISLRPFAPTLSR